MVELLRTKQFILRRGPEGYLVAAIMADGSEIIVGPEPDTVRGLATALKLCAMILEGKLKLNKPAVQYKPELVKPLAQIISIVKSK